MLFVSRHENLIVFYEDTKFLPLSDGTFHKQPAKAAEFHFGQFVTRDEDIIEKLLTNRSYGRLFTGPFSLAQVKSGEWKELFKKDLTGIEKLKDPDVLVKPIKVVEGLRTTNVR